VIGEVVSTEAIVLLLAVSTEIILNSATKPVHTAILLSRNKNMFGSGRLTNGSKHSSDWIETSTSPWVTGK
jgi:hypothetical protein